MTARIDQLGRTTAYEYDTQGRRTLVRHPDQGTAYDAEGRVTSRADRMGRVRYTGYDNRGRMTSTTFDGASIAYAYDLDGRLTATTDPRGFTTTQAYDEAGRVTETRTPSTPRRPTRPASRCTTGRVVTGKKSILTASANRWSPNDRY